MKRDIAAIHAMADATQIREILGRHKYSVFPLIDSVANKVLLGSITRTELSHSVEMSMPRFANESGHELKIEFILDRSIRRQLTQRRR
jgi:CBS-domain-containing membrane protein